MNVASRIEGLCRTLAYPVLISEAVAGRGAASLTPVGSYSIRGSATPVALFTLPELASKPDAD